MQITACCRQRVCNVDTWMVQGCDEYQEVINMFDLIKRGERHRDWDPMELFDEVHWPRSWPFSQSGQMLPATDITETDDAYEVVAELPGISKEDIKVSIKDGVLTINAEREQKQEEKDKKASGRVIRQERHYGKYVRSLRLGGDIKEAEIQAAFDNGVLKLTLPKVPDTEPRRLDIKLD